MQEIVLQAKDLCKSYGKFQALEHVNFSVRRGDVYGLIGKNGAGKTTIMKIVAGLTQKSEGDVELFAASSMETVKARARIGCLIENPAFYPNMTAWQNLKYYAIQRGVTDMGQIEEALRLVGLGDTGKKKFRAFSLGMKQRLGIALALLDNPDLLILDEPINGLDPIGISELRETFRLLNEERGMTIIISSHILTELYAVSNQFLFINQGKVLKEMSKEELDDECRRCILIRVTDTKKAAAVLEDELQITDYKVVSQEELRIYDKSRTVAELNRALVQKDVEVFYVSEAGIPLEDYFKALIAEE